MAHGTIGASDESVWGPLRVPPVSARSVASSINRQLDGSSDIITLSRAEATETVLTLTSCSDNEVELAKVSAEAKRTEYFARLGDYAGRVVDWVMKATENKKDLPSSVSKMRGARQDIAFEGIAQRKLWESLSDDVRQLAESNRPKAFQDGKFRQNIEQEPGFLRKRSSAEKPEALVNRLNDWHSKDPRRALQWLSKISTQLDEKLQE
ncbi:hypothetical protein FQN53_008834 [Emmonsiellopsis sp. PD_33]|nr:hypothetical protein FQN53_008834 [Emmonsiellopsis sp. PD_33]